MLTISALEENFFDGLSPIRVEDMFLGVGSVAGKGMQIEPAILFNSIDSKLLLERCIKSGIFVPLYICFIFEENEYRYYSCADYYTDDYIKSGRSDAYKKSWYLDAFKMTIEFLRNEGLLDKAFFSFQ